MASARKSAGWLIALLTVATVLLALLALLALVAYFAITYEPAHSAPAWLFPFAIALLGAVWMCVLGDIAWNVLPRQPRSRAHWMRQTRSVLLALGGTIMPFGAIGQHYRWWTHGTAESAPTWTGCLLVLGVTASRLMSEHHLLSALKARAATKRRPSD
jgi:hypothetical protein